MMFHMGEHISADTSVAELRELNRRGLVWRREIPEYSVWIDMKKRCNSPNHKDYHHYGGRGITVHSEWNEDFFAWLTHIGRRPVDGLTLERIDNGRGYEPGNVCWATMKAQMNNRRPSILINLHKKSRYHGVTRNHDNWQAQITVNGCQKYLGTFPNETDAAIAWNTHVAYLGLDRELNEIRAEDYIHD